ncbi:SDR family NAD(P)-dependent oxidoreductase [Nocardia sp. NPDC051750]|uniref:SDR family NAD(P)-dependent oxidoreductase n=1 Tax=Nocardia sp. NPDC051750 TaxID=3364325 RepID=UPI0037A8513A
MQDLRGRGYIVTGAASGIGLGTCRKLVSAGAAVAMLDRDIGKLETEAAGLATRGSAFALGCDVADEDSVAAAVADAAARLPSVAGVCTSAGVFEAPDLLDLEDLDMAVFDRVLDINLRGTVLVLRAVLPLLGAGGAIVTVASTAGLRGHGYGMAYTASKGGVVALTRRTALRYGPKGIRVNCVCPGATAGEGLGSVFDDEQAAAQTSADLPLRRVGRADEVGATIAVLLSDDTSYVTGQVLAVDGGMVIR